jgi:hypothetical protein
MTGAFMIHAGVSHRCTPMSAPMLSCRSEVVGDAADDTEGNQ